MQGSLSSTPLWSWSDFRLLTTRIASQYLSTQLYGVQGMEPRSLCVLGKSSSDRLISVFWKVNFLAKCKVTIIDYMEVKCTFRILLSVPEEAFAIICIPWGWLSLCTLSVFLDLLCVFLDYIVLLGAINMFIYSVTDHSVWIKNPSHRFKVNTQDNSVQRKNTMTLDLW